MIIMVSFPAIKRRMAVLGALLALAVIERSPAADISFRDTAEIQPPGIKMNVLTGATAQGLPAPEMKMIHTEQGLQDAMTGFDNWVRRQWLGRWALPDGSFMLAAEMKCLLPSPLLARYLSADDYANFEKKFGAPVTNATQTAAWLSALSSARVVDGPASLAASLRLQHIERYTLASGKSHWLAYAIRFRPNVSGVDTARQFALIFHTPGVDIAAFAAQIEKDVLPSILLLPPSRTVGPGGSRPGSGSSVGAGKGSAALEASRLVALHSIEGQKDWWASSSEHYVIVTNIKKNRQKWLDQIQTDVERLRAAYEKLVPPLQPIDSVGMIRIFNEDAAYQKYVGPEHAWSGGLWNPELRELCIRSSDQGSMKQQREWILEVVYHESMHQYIFYAFGGRSVPVWFHEGHASLTEGMEWGPGGWIIGEPERHRALVDTLVKKNLLDFGPLLSMDFNEFYDGTQTDSQKRSVNYSTAWALAYYLHKVAPLDRGGPDAKLLDEYLRASREGGGDATRVVFTPEVIARLNKNFTAFWKSGALRLRARNFNPLKTASPR